MSFYAISVVINPDGHLLFHQKFNCHEKKSIPSKINFSLFLIFLCFISCNEKAEIAENNLLIVPQLIDAWNQGDSLRLATFYADDFLYEDIAFDIHIQSDKNELKKLVHETVTLVPDSHMEILSKTANDSVIVTEWVWTGTVLGATEPFLFRGASVVKIKNDKIIYHADYYPIDAEYLKQAQENLANQSMQ